LARSVYSRDLKIAAMRALDAGSATGEIARKYQLSPKLLERWRGEWRAKGESAFPGIGSRGAGVPALDDARRIAELERKIGQLTMENDFLKKALQHVASDLHGAGPRGAIPSASRYQRADHLQPVAGDEFDVVGMPSARSRRSAAPTGSGSDSRMRVASNDPCPRGMQPWDSARSIHSASHPRGWRNRASRCTVTVMLERLRSMVSASLSRQLGRTAMVALKVRSARSGDVTPEESGYGLQSATRAAPAGGPRSRPATTGTEWRAGVSVYC
jgi:transposase